MSDDQVSPVIGQLVDFFPSQSQRFAAIVVQVQPCDEDARPTVSLQIFQPDGKLQYSKSVEPAAYDDDSDDGANLLKGRWAFQQEFCVEEDDDHDEDTVLGTGANRQVGSFSL